MLTGLQVLENTDWSRLLHAYDRATDTPDQLRALLSEDPELRRRAMQHLWSAIMHQGTPWTATGPVSLVIAGLLADERIDHGESLRVPLLSFLTCVAEVAEQADADRVELERLAQFDLEPFLDADDDEALYENEEAADALNARSVLGCLEVSPVLMDVMIDALDHADPVARSHAAMGAVALAKTSRLRHRSGELERRLLALTESAKDTDERSALVLALGDLGLTPTMFMTDPSPAVRMCAALAPALAANEEAIDELIRTLERDAASIDGWFAEKPPQFEMRPRFAVVARLVRQVTDFDRLVDAAISVVETTDKRRVDYEWGPLLAAAFPAGNGNIENQSQHRFLSALVAKSDLWDPKFGNSWKWFKKTGLPNDRDECARLVEASLS